MKKIYYVRTNGYDMIATYNTESKEVRYTTADFITEYINNLSSIEDDSSWEVAENVNDFEEWLGISNDPESPEIITELEF